MRPSWLLSPTVLIASLSWCGAVRAGLEGDPSAFDAGTVHAGAPLSHRFMLTNRGSEIVEIIESRPSCGCVTTTPDRRRFGPGESGSLLLAVNTLTRPDGPASWGVTLRCRCGERVAETTLTLTAHVRADLSLEPSALVVETDGAVDRSITLTDRRPTRMTIKAETTCPQVRASVDAPAPLPNPPPAGGGGQGGGWIYAIHLAAPADLPEGRYDEALHLYTSDPEYPDLKLPFTIVKRGLRRVSATPAEVELSIAAPSRRLLLHGGDGDEVEIGGVDTDAAAVTCDWTAGSRPTAAVRLRLDAAKLPADGVRTVVHIHLTRPAGATVDVPVTCMPR
jgi:hypothetical protein